MAANLVDLFGESEDDNDDFETDFKVGPGEDEHAQVSRPTALKEGAEPLRGEEEASEDAIKERLESGLVSHVQDYSDEEDSQGIVKETYERPIGPPAELKGALLPLPAIDKLRLLQTSRFLGVQTLPMTSGNLMAEREGAELDESTSEVRYSYRKQLTIRWREKRLSPHESRIESNARFVTWSDGSKQLLLGDEVLDIGELDNTSANQFLFVRHTGPVRFIQGQGQLTKKMQLRPASLTSKFHKQLTADAQRKHVRINKVKATATVADPNQAKANREKAEEERIKSKESLQRRQEKEMKKYPAVPRRDYRPAGITPHFLETMEDEPDYSDEDDLTATERARAALQRRQLEEEDGERKAEQRLAEAKQAQSGFLTPPVGKRPQADSRSHQDSETQRRVLADSDDEEDDISKSQPAKRLRRGLVLSDNEDE